jgi:hypothetical protein
MRGTQDTELTLRRYSNAPTLTTTLAIYQTELLEATQIYPLEQRLYSQTMAELSKPAVFECFVLLMCEVR